MGNTRVGVSQLPHSGDQYPFLRRRPEDAGVEARIVDFMVQYRPYEHSVPLKIAAISIDAAVTLVNFLVSDSENNVIFLTSEHTVDISDYGPNRLAVWKDGELQVFAVISHAEEATYYSGALWLDPRTYVPVIQPAQRVFVHTAADAEPVELDLNKTLSLADGVNTAVFSTGADSSLRKEVQMSSGGIIISPGVGEGFSEKCVETSTVLRKLNGVSTERGDITLAGDDCLRVEPVLSQVGDDYELVEGKLKLFDDCSPCCETQDYLDVYHTMENLYRRVATATQTLESVREEYVQLLESLEIPESCHNNVILFLRCYPEDASTVVVGGMYNASNVEVNNLKPVFSIYYRPETGEGEGESCWVDYLGEGIAFAWKSAVRFFGRSRIMKNVFYFNYPEEGANPGDPDAVHRLTSEVDCLPPDRLVGFYFRVPINFDARIKVCLHDESNPEYHICSEVDSFVTLG